MATLFGERSPDPARPDSTTHEQAATSSPSDQWLRRAFSVATLFHHVYTPCWEGAYGALGDAYLFAATGDSSLLRFHTGEHDLRQMCEGTWLDDRAWVCLAELKWWNVSGKRNMGLVTDAVRRYDEAKAEGRLSSHEGFWSWYNWPPHANVNERIFTNSNMNQMVTVACKLYDVTGERRFLEDALLVWNGDRKVKGIESNYYRGNGVWEGRGGHAAFGNELPWGGTGYCSVAAALYLATRDERYRSIAVATANYIMDPATGWIDPNDFYQLRMDGNGAFVHFLLDAYEIAPSELRDLLPKIEMMLEHVWTNNHGRAIVTLHREVDHGIRNGWNPRGGEEGYGVGEVGTVHAQGEAARAFGVFAYFQTIKDRSSSAAEKRPGTQ
ncbi:MAG TPA: hypothetical protein VFG32_05330 [Bacteroidota bacterium]|nr:hypothetical protein [Bacteroidota bacterium]